MGCCLRVGAWCLSFVALQFDILYDPAAVSLGTVNGGAALTGSHSVASNPVGPGRGGTG